MHTPDGFLTGWVCVLMMLLSTIPIALAVRSLRKGLLKAHSIAAVAAIIFLAQMINFPIAGGTSGHLIGAVFALVILGVEGAVIAMAAVLLLQAVVFGDGGMLSLGANIFNMGILSVYSANFVMQRLEAERHLKIFLASWTAVVAASAAASVQLALSGTIALGVVLPAMLVTHSVIGIAEGLLTVLMVAVAANSLKNPSLRLSLGISGASFLIIAALLPFASEAPDGLERIAINLGFFAKQFTLYSAPLADYALPLFAVPYLAVLSAALIGSALAFALAYLSARVIASPFSVSLRH